MKTCYCCEQEKEIEEFSRDRQRADGRDPRCKRCRSERRRTGRPRGRPRDPQLAMLTSTQRIRRVWLMQRYRISPEEHDALFEYQDGVCWVCQQPPKGECSLDVDHDHATGEVRGLLCKRCNQLMRALDDELFERLIDYKNYPPARAVISPHDTMGQAHSNMEET